jgi:uncharacterized protein YhbP (UPF0306 family)
MAFFFDLEQEKVDGEYYCQCCFYRFDQRNETIIYLKVDKGYQICFHLSLSILIDIRTLFKKNRFKRNIHDLFDFYDVLERNKIFFILP